MDSNRRCALQTGGGIGLAAALSAIGLLPASAAAQGLPPAAWQAKTVAEALRALGAASPAETNAVTIVSPDIAENGAVVPVGIRSTLPKTEMVALLVEKNPQTLAGAYDIPEGTDADVNMRIKMGQSSDVFALVKADGKWFMAKKEIKVTLGGCGG